MIWAVSSSVSTGFMEAAFTSCSYNSDVLIFSMHLPLSTIFSWVKFIFLISRSTLCHLLRLFTIMSSIKFYYKKIQGPKYSRPYQNHPIVSAFSLVTAAVSVVVDRDASAISIPSSCSSNSTCRTHLIQARIRDLNTIDPKIKDITLAGGIMIASFAAVDTELGVSFARPKIQTILGEDAFAVEPVIRDIPLAFLCRRFEERGKEEVGDEDDRREQKALTTSEACWRYYQQWCPKLKRCCAFCWCQRLPNRSRWCRT